MYVCMEIIIQVIIFYCVKLFSSKVYATDALETYVHELKLHGAMAPCDCTLKNFVLQDLFIETGTLKVCIRFPQVYA